MFGDSTGILNKRLVVRCTVSVLAYFQKKGYYASDLQKDGALPPKQLRTTEGDMRPDMPHEGHGPHWVNQACPRCSWISPQKYLTLSSVSYLGSQMGGGPQNTVIPNSYHLRSA